MAMLWACPSLVAPTSRFAMIGSSVSRETTKLADHHLLDHAECMHHGSYMWTWKTTRGEVSSRLRNTHMSMGTSDRVPVGTLPQMIIFHWLTLYSN